MTPDSSPMVIPPERTRTDPMTTSTMFVSDGMTSRNASNQLRRRKAYTRDTRT